MASHEDDELADDLDELAEGLASLSQESRMPTGAGPSAEPFGREAVRFETNEWFMRLLAVQAWLCLPSPLVLGTGADAPRAVLQRLFDDLRVPTPSECYSINDGGIASLTPLGVSTLYHRVETARKLQEAFVQDEESDGIDPASDRWRQSWDEESVGTAESFEFNAQVDSWAIRNFVNYCRERQLELAPSYQRGDVWPKADAQKLIESILKGIPLPSIILVSRWVKGQQIYEVVDGKQRLTAMLRFIGEHPRAVDAVREWDQSGEHGGALEAAFRRDYRKEFKRRLKARNGKKLTASDEAGSYLPFALPRGLEGALKPLSGKFYSEIQDMMIRVGKKDTRVKQIFEALNATYKIPVITYDDTDVRAIHEVFRLYNKQGKHLNPEELRNALYGGLDFMKLCLALAGDNTRYDDLVPWTSARQRQQMKEVALALTEYGFGTSRFMRTKVLCWFLSIVLQPPPRGGDTGDVRITPRATSSQIDAMFETIDVGRAHPLRDCQGHLPRLLDSVANTLTAHSASSRAWHTKFRNQAGVDGWLELPLVATLVGTFLICTAEGRGAASLEGHEREIHDYTERRQRPKNRQNSTQWGFISAVALEMCRRAGVDEDALAARLKHEYDYSCLDTLRLAARFDEVQPGG